MKLNAIRCQNFFSHKDTEIDLDEVGSPVLITGENGAGKSSCISEALTYALFGETRVESLDDVIRDNQNEMAVTIGFEINGQDIMIVRSKKRGKSQKLAMYINSNPVSELASETQLRINKLIGLSYNAFRSSVILRQEDQNFFIAASPDDRKKIISEILDLNAYEKLEKIARERRQEIKSEIKAEQNILNTLELENIEELNDNLAQVDEHLTKFPEKIAKAQEKLDLITAHNANIKESIERHEKELANKRILENRIENYRLDKSKKEIELNNLKKILIYNPTNHILNDEKSIGKLETLTHGRKIAIKTFKESYTEIVNQAIAKYQQETFEPLQNEYAIAQNNFKELQKKFKKAEEAGLKCEACDRLFEDAAERKSYALNLHTQITTILGTIQELELLLKNAETVFKSIKSGSFTKAQELNKNILEVEEWLTNEETTLKELRIKHHENLTAQRKYEVAQSRIESLHEAIKTLSDTIYDLTEQAKSLAFEPLITSEPLDESVPRKKVNELREAEKAGLKIKSQLEQRIEAGTKSNQRHQEITDGLNSKIYRLSMLEKLCIAFSRKGVPAAIIETVLPEIEETANRYLDRMSEGNLAIRFNTLATLKNGDQRETLDIEVFDGQNWRISDSFSGGEKFRVSLSIRLALSHILAQRAGIDLQTLILDEGGTSLDGPGKEIFVSTIKSLSNYFSRIILITHLDFKDEFEHRINLSKSESETVVL